MNEDILIDDNRKIDVKNIDTYYDLYDQACMLVFEGTSKEYLECMIDVYHDLSNGECERHKLEDEDFQKYQEIINTLSNFYLLNEEIRQALLLLIIKGFKHKNKNLDSITPDLVGLVFAYLIKKMYEGKNKKVSIIDCALGTSNLLNTVINNVSFDVDAIGIEIDNQLSRLAEAVSDLQGNDIRIYNNSCLLFPMSANVIIGDLDNVRVNDVYLPFDVILSFSLSALENTMMLFMIDNDFFNQKGIDTFKEKFNGTIMGLIILPQDMFKGIGKSILVVSPKKYKNYQTLVSSLPSLSEGIKFQDALRNVGSWLKEINNKK